MPNSKITNTQQPIAIREALTSYNKQLLWTAKQRLQEHFKFIWYKKGIIRAKKNEKTDSNVIRSEDDIKKLLEVQ